MSICEWGAATNYWELASSLQGVEGFAVMNLELHVVGDRPRSLASVGVSKSRREVQGSSVWRVQRKKILVGVMATNSSKWAVHFDAFEECGRPQLAALADRLRHYRAPPSAWASADDETHETKGALKLKRAAVLVCLFQGAEGELRVILTKRASSLSSHSGEVALPGGKRDEGEDDIATALREAHEEIGLHPSHVHIVTLLKPFLSKHLLTVTPVVAILPEQHKFEPRPNAGEVDSIFDVPLQMFLKDEGHYVEDIQWLSVTTRVHCFAFVAPDGNKYNIWGLTAAVLIHAASLVLQRPPDFPEDLPDFGALIDIFKCRT